ncbi:MAG: PQQ-dependent sugar dehydrogenase [Bacillota bacterium]
MLARLWRYTALVVVAFLLLLATQWKGLPIRTERQIEPRRVDPAAIQTPPGWKIEAVLTGLDAPADLAWGPDGRLYIAETGFAGAYAATSGVQGVYEGRILQWEPGRPVQVYAAGFTPPLSGLAWGGPTLYASHRGKITAVGPGPSRVDLVTGLPSYGDHGNNHLAIDAEGTIYITQGTVTNTGIVGLDNYVLDWPLAYPGVHDIPCRDVRLTDQNYATADPRALLPLVQRTRTGGYQPFGMAARGGVARGEVPCNGAVMRVRPDGSNLEVVAWGLRNPFGIAFDRTGRLLVTDNGPDSRGSRPVEGLPDLLREVRPGTWHGWPDLWEKTPLGKPLLAKHPAIPPAPVARFEPHAGAAGMTVGPDGWIYVAQVGSSFPATAQDPAATGFNVVRVHPRTGKVETVLANRRKGPQSWDRSGGLERPVALRWGPDGDLWVLDYGRIQVTRKGPWVVPQTGVLWRVSRR